MSQRAELLTRLVRTALGRPNDATAAGVPGASDDAVAGALSPASDTMSDAGPRATAAELAYDPGIVSVLAEKVLLAWLRNRYQLLFPFALDLRRLDDSQAELLLYAMIAAAQADGSLDGQERHRVEGVLSLVDPSEDERAFLDAALEHPKSLNEVLSQVHDVQTGALVYAASLMAVDQRKPVNRYFLKYLAARLQLSEELVGSLEQRFHSSS